MSDDGSVELADLLRGFAAGHARAAAATAPDPSVEVLQLASRVRRRRMRRAGTAATAGVAAVLVGAVAVYGVTRPDPVPPAPQPTQSQDPTPESPSPTPSADPTVEPTTAPTEPEGITRHELLPDVLPVPTGIWAQTDAEWLLGGYSATRSEPDGSFMRSPSVLYLVAPDGTTYEVPVPDVLLAPTPTAGSWVLEDWRPGDSRAVFVPPIEVDSDQDLEQVVVDLATGEELVRYPFGDQLVLLAGDRTLVLRPTDDGRSAVQIHDRDGYHLHKTGPFARPEYVDRWPDSRGWAVDPSRTQLLLDTPEGITILGLPDLTPLAMPQLPAPATAPCRAVGWLEQDRLVVRCAEAPGDAQAAALWIANLGDGSTRRLTTARTPDLYQVAEVWQVGADVVASRTWIWPEYGESDPEPVCGLGVAVIGRDGVQTVVPGVGVMNVKGVRGGHLVGSTYACEGGDSAALVSLDVATGQVSMVLPRVEGASVSFARAVGLGQTAQWFGSWD